MILKIQNQPPFLFYILCTNFVYPPQWGSVCSVVPYSMKSYKYEDIKNL